MDKENEKNKLFYLKRIGYLQKEELKIKLAKEIAIDEKDDAALKRLTDNLEKIQNEIDGIICLLSKDTEIRERCMQQWDKLNYAEVKASYGVKFARDENNKRAAEKFEDDLIKAKVRKKKVEDLLNSSYLLREKPKKMYITDSKKKKPEASLKFNESDEELDAEFENAKKIGEVQEIVDKTIKTDDDKKLAKEYMDD